MYDANGNMTSVVPLNVIKPTVGAWALTNAANKWTLDHTVAADTSILHIPLPLIGSDFENGGSILKSIEIFWSNATADIVDIVPMVYVNSLPANGGAQVVTAQNFLYDAAHNTTALRKTQAVHNMNIELTGPVPVVGDVEIFLSLSINAAATSVFKLIGIKANYMLRL